MNESARRSTSESERNAADAQRRRLTRDSLPSRPTLPQNVELPPDGWDRQDIGIIHLGLGAFHRAHQAAFLDDHFRASGDDRWGVCGATQRSATVRSQLAPQDGLYGLLEPSASAPRLRVIGSLRRIIFPREEMPALMTRFSSASVSLVTLTITEKGYRRVPGGGLDVADLDVSADLAGHEPTTAIGQLVAGLRARADTADTPISVLSCDNLIDNGATLERLVHDFCLAKGDHDLIDWIGKKVSFPSTMVDRIVPATTPTDHLRAEAMLGLRDEGLVVAEGFRQWVIEDRFVADRPHWEDVGVQIVRDVRPFEQMKLRILNGAHSALAYLGALRGHRTIVEAIADPQLFAFVQALIDVDVIPTLSAPESVDVRAYGNSVLDRFSNPGLAHTTTQVAADGSQKIPVRLLSTLTDARANGHVPTYVIRAIAGWMVYVSLPQSLRGAMPLPLSDPIAAELITAARGLTSPAQIVDALLAFGQIFPPALAEDRSVREALVEAVMELRVA